jgi:hypothetical protein
MILSDPIDHRIYIFIGLDLDERAAIFFDSWESMEILYEVLASFHHPMSSLHLPEEVSMFSHGREDLIECWLIVPREESPRVTKACSPNHESVEVFESGRVYHLCDPILIREDITIAYHWDTHMLLELVDTSEISSPSECLLVGTTMD